MPKVSVIVPIYNKEKYLVESIESLREQTLSNIELVLVNDGSTDGSLTICERYAEIDPRIQVVSQANGGVSSARNLGLDVARGDYLGFVDPDDWVESKMYEKMYDTVRRTQTDICMCNYVMEFPDKSVPVQLKIDSEKLNKNGILTEIVANMLAGPSLNSGSQVIGGSVCRLLIRKDIVDKNRIRFPIGIPLAEDLLFTIQVLLRSDKLSIEEGQYYHYMIRSGSAVRTYRQELQRISWEVHDSLHHILEKEDVLRYFEARMDRRYVDMVIRLIVNEVHADNTKSVTDKIRSIREYCRDNKLKEILSNVETKGYTLRRKAVLTGLQREWGIFLFVYYTLLSRLISCFSHPWAEN